MKRATALVFCFLLISAFRPAGHSEVNRTELVFCVDLSASTNGILHDLRTGIWNIINTSYEEKNNLLRVGVVGYARPSFGGSDGYVKIISNLTSDFDPVVYSLYQMKVQIEKGDHFVPNALKTTLSRISWSNDPFTKRVVYLIGNGSVYTGPLNLINICEDFKKRGIVINAMYVELDKADEININGYETIAQATQGEFFRIRPSGTVEWKDRMSEAGVFYSMNHSFNSTLMFYSADAENRKKFVFETDKYTLQNGVNFFMQRLRTKVSDHYQKTAETYDLVSYYLKNQKLPPRINSDFLLRSEKISDLSMIEEKVKQKAIARIRIRDEIRYIFQDAVRTDVADSALNSIVTRKLN